MTWMDFVRRVERNKILVALVWALDVFLVANIAHHAPGGALEAVLAGGMWMTSVVGTVACMELLCAFMLHLRFRRQSLDSAHDLEERGADPDVVQAVSDGHSLPYLAWYSGAAVGAKKGKAAGYAQCHSERLKLWWVGLHDAPTAGRFVVAQTSERAEELWCAELRHQRGDEDIAIEEIPTNLEHVVVP
ncbi:MAG: hypothetical protein HRU11_13975 [Parvularculaceae bacterium]|nr:hypothetical protein [Parvularculaceae bacterium]